MCPRHLCRAAHHAQLAASAAPSQAAALRFLVVAQAAMMLAEQYAAADAIYTFCIPAG